ncbi:MAG TPA: T9SS type A sorting domain-containing protein [Bacteroidia bacterium]|nr:T9SS type A sorting domain-containing protein [Bacteroidia bacterium]
MKKSPLTHFKLLILFLFIGLYSFAGDERAGYISYTHTSGNTYHFKIYTYTDPTEMTADRCEETLIFSGISSGTSIYLNCTRTNTTPGVDLENLNPPLANCPTNSAVNQGLILVYPFTHTCPTITNYGGVKLNIYEADYTFSGNGTYIIGMVDPNLPPNILNVNNSQNVAFALMDTLKISSFLPYNNSPIFSATLVDSVYRGQTFNYNLNLTDADSDSLSYSLTPFITGDTTGGVYAASGTSIPAGMVIDAVTGNLSWPTTATTQYGLYDIDILVKEYRLVGGVRIEIGSEVFSTQINVICNSASGINKVVFSGNQLSIYPNPANDESIINFSLSHPQQVSLELYDLQGNLIKRIAKGKVSEGKNQYEVSLTDITEGTYFYHLVTEDGISEKKLVVIKN